jgi:hypothetical protein
MVFIRFFGLVCVTVSSTLNISDEPFCISGSYAMLFEFLLHICFHSISYLDFKVHSVYFSYFHPISIEIVQSFMYTVCYLTM